MHSSRTADTARAAGRRRRGRRRSRRRAPSGGRRTAASEGSARPAARRVSTRECRRQNNFRASLGSKRDCCVFVKRI